MPKKSRFPVVRSTWPRIVDYTETPLRSFMVDGRRRGDGKREYFKSVGDAKTRANQLAVERENHGTALLDFPAKDRVMAVECRELLRPFGRTIREATLQFIAHLESERTNSKLPLIKECAAQYLVARQRDFERKELSSRSVAEARQCMKRLTSVMGDELITSLTVERVRAYLDSFPVSAISRHDLRLRLSGFCSFCKPWLGANPCAEIKIKVPRHEVTILTVDETERLLRCAEASKFRNVLVPYVALCLFGGLRPFEAAQLDWRNVDFATNHIHVLAHTSKKREGRYVQMEPALVRWLMPFAKLSGRICGANFRKQWESLIKAAGYGAARKWKQDVMRHTAASMLLAIKRNRALVAEELGTSLEVLRRHYRQPILKVVAKRFWALSPKAAPSAAEDEAAQANNSPQAEPAHA